VTRRRRSRGSDGQATVELALLLPVVLVLVLAILQVGLLARDVMLVTHAAREAARAAATDPDPGVARAAALASSGLDPTRLVVTVTTTGDGTTDRRVRVEVTYRAPTAVPLVGALVADRTIRTTATMRLETLPPDGYPSRIAWSRWMAAALSRCSLAFPHLGDCTHDGHPSPHPQASTLSRVARR